MYQEMDTLHLPAILHELLEMLLIRMDLEWKCYVLCPIGMWLCPSHSPTPAPWAAVLAVVGALRGLNGDELPPEPAASFTSRCDSESLKLLVFSSSLCQLTSSTAPQGNICW